MSTRHLASSTLLESTLYSLISLMENELPRPHSLRLKTCPQGPVLCFLCLKIKPLLLSKPSAF